MKSVSRAADCLLNGVAYTVMACIAVVLILMLAVVGIVLAVEHSESRGAGKEVAIENVFDQIYYEGEERLSKAEWLRLYTDGGDKHFDYIDESGRHLAAKTSRAIYFGQGDSIRIRWIDYYQADGAEEIRMVYEFSYIPEYRLLVCLAPVYEPESSFYGSLINTLGIDKSTIQSYAIDAIEETVKDCIRAFGDDVDFSETYWGEFEVHDLTNLNLLDGIETGRQTNE